LARRWWGGLGVILKAARGLTSRKPSVPKELPPVKCVHAQIRSGGNRSSTKWAHCKTCKGEDGKALKLWSINLETGAIEVKLDRRLDAAEGEAKESMPSAVFRYACRLAGRNPEADRKQKAREDKKVDWSKYFMLIKRLTDKEVSEEEVKSELVAQGDDETVVENMLAEVRGMSRAGRSSASSSRAGASQPTSSKEAKGAGQDCPSCGVSMLLRARREDGNPFWGCSSYPECKQTRPYEGDIFNTPCAGCGEVKVLTAKPADPRNYCCRPCRSTSLCEVCLKHVPNYRMDAMRRTCQACQKEQADAQKKKDETAYVIHSDEEILSASVVSSPRLSDSSGMMSEF